MITICCFKFLEQVTLMAGKRLSGWLELYPLENIWFSLVMEDNKHGANHAHNWILILQKIHTSVSVVDWIVLFFFSNPPVLSYYPNAVFFCSGIKYLRLAYRIPYIYRVVLVEVKKCLYSIYIYIYTLIRLLWIHILISLSFIEQYE